MRLHSSFILNIILFTALLLVVIAFVLHPGRFVPITDSTEQVSGQNTD